MHDTVIEVRFEGSVGCLLIAFTATVPVNPIHRARQGGIIAEKNVVFASAPPQYRRTITSSGSFPGAKL